MKPDLKAFRKLRALVGFDEWYKDLMTLSRSMGTQEILDPRHRSGTSREAVDLFDALQYFMYAVFRYTVIPAELRQYVEAEIETSDAQKVIEDIRIHMRKSTHAIISTKDMMESIVNNRLNLTKHTKSVYEYVVEFDALFSLYNKHQRIPQMRINVYHRRTYLQNALAGIKTFRDITEREMDRVTMGEGDFTYAQYLTAVKSAATRIDALRSTKPHREVNMMLQDGYYDDDDETPSRDSGYEVNEMKRRPRNPGDYSAQMNKDTWTSLSKETQTIWDQIDKADKEKILTYRKDRESRRQSNAKSDINATITSPSLEANVHETVTEDDDSELAEETKISINNTVTQARKEAHPGDPRRVLGSDKGSDKKSQLKAMMHRLAYPGDSDSGSDDDDSDDDTDHYNSYWKENFR